MTQNLRWGYFAFSRTRLVDVATGHDKCNMQKDIRSEFRNMV